MAAKCKFCGVPISPLTNEDHCIDWGVSVNRPGGCYERQIEQQQETIERRGLMLRKHQYDPSRCCVGCGNRWGDGCASDCRLALELKEWAMDSIKCGQRVVVYISNRHDFRRYATIIGINNQDAVAEVKYDNGECEIVPLRWIN